MKFFAIHGAILLLRMLLNLHPSNENIMEKTKFRTAAYLSQERWFRVFIIGHQNDIYWIDESLKWPDAHLDELVMLDIYTSSRLSWHVISNYVTDKNFL